MTGLSIEQRVARLERLADERQREPGIYAVRWGPDDHYAAAYWKPDGWHAQKSGFKGGYWNAGTTQYPPFWVGPRLDDAKEQGPGNAA